ncbi:MAG: hypothetical protein IPK97_10520 [Ahniella sp.]|nr:hypothetical protein [Ahniella sp.]
MTLRQAPALERRFCRPVEDRARRNCPGHQRRNTLNTRALVNEAYIQAVRRHRPHYSSRKHFFATASPHASGGDFYARQRLADCRGAGAEHVSIDDLEGSCAAVEARGN